MPVAAEQVAAGQFVQRCLGVFLLFLGEEVVHVLDHVLMNLIEKLQHCRLVAIGVAQLLQGRIDDAVGDLIVQGAHPFPVLLLQSGHTADQCGQFAVEPFQGFLEPRLLLLGQRLELIPASSACPP